MNKFYTIIAVRFYNEFLVIKQVINDGWRAIKLGYLSSRRDKYGFIDKTAIVLQPFYANKKNVFLYEHVNIGESSRVLSVTGKFIMRKYSISGPCLTVITQNHDFEKVGKYPDCLGWHTDQISDDVIVEDYVWIGVNVTLCPGVHIGRGCLVAAGSVCVRNKEYPPYTIVGGNPAKIIKYRFTLEEQLQHEELLYNENERIPVKILTEKWEKYNFKK